MKNKRYEKFKIPMGFRRPTATDTKRVRKLTVIKKQTKIGKVELYLLSRRWVKSWQAINFWGYTRLADGIFKLRRKFRLRGMGMIITDIEFGMDRYENPSHWGRYLWVLPTRYALAKKKRRIKK